jgi:hypothetical protein
MNQRRTRRRPYRTGLLNSSFQLSGDSGFGTLGASAFGSDEGAPNDDTFTPSWGTQTFSDSSWDGQDYGSVIDAAGNVLGKTLGGVAQIIAAESGPSDAPDQMGAGGASVLPDWMRTDPGTSSGDPGTTTKSAFPWPWVAAGGVAVVALLMYTGRGRAKGA